jgi:phage tail P2-like protein
MNDVAYLLPINASQAETALARAVARVSDVPLPLRDIWNAETCPADMLDLLAWSYSVDEWDAGWSDDAKRATIRDSLLVQRRKGSVWSVRRALTNAGYPDAVIDESRFAIRYDGLRRYDGQQNYQPADLQWATYRVTIPVPISISQSHQVRRILESVAPARCQLIEFVFIQAANLYDGKINFNGTFSYGTI